MNATAGSLISRFDAVKLISERIHQKGETPQDARNRVSHRIAYAMKSGELNKSVAGFELNDVICWARKKWPTAFIDLAAQNFAQAESKVTAASFTDGIILPGSLERCHALIQELHNRIEILETQLGAANREIDKLSPSAAKWEELRVSNAANSKRRRK